MANGAADPIWQLWNAGEVIDDLPLDLKFYIRAEGRAIQAHLESYKRPLFGGKIAATSKAGQNTLASPDRSPGASSPSERSKTAPISSSARTACGLRNPSLPFALPPRSNLGVKNIRLRTCCAVGSLHLAIEIPDSGSENFATVGEAQLIADNACAHEFILGSATEADWRAIDLST